VRIAPDLLDAIVEHARREAPDECCGMIAVREGAAVSVREAENVEHSPFRFNVHPLQLLHFVTEAEEAGHGMAIYHSHTRSEPYPSQTDIRFAADWPGVEWLIVGLQNGDAEVRCYRIDSGTVTEVPVERD
jgi:proteasome lid subunit RPN8/RPN11